MPQGPQGSRGAKKLAALVVSYCDHVSERNDCDKKVKELKKNLMWLVDDQTSLETDRYVVQHVQRTAKVVDQKLLSPSEREKYTRTDVVTSLHATSLDDPSEGKDEDEEDQDEDQEKDDETDSDTDEATEDCDHPKPEDLDELAASYVEETDRRRRLDRTCREERELLLEMFDKHKTNSFVVEGRARLEKVDKAVNRVSVKDLPASVKARCTVVQVRNMLNVVDKKQMKELGKRKQRS